MLGRANTRECGCGDSEPRADGMSASGREYNRFEGCAAKEEHGVGKANFTHDKEANKMFRTVNRRMGRARER